MGGFFSRLFTCLAIACTLCFPIVQRLDLYGDPSEKKLSFSLRLYGFLPILGGYVTSYTGGIAIHLGKKKAVLLPYRGIEEKRKKFSFVRSFKTLMFHVSTETGAEYLFGVLSVHAAMKTYFSLTRKASVFRSEVWLVGGRALKCSVKTSVCFTPLALIVLCLKFVVKYLKGSIKRWKMKEKSIV